MARVKLGLLSVGVRPAPEVVDYISRNLPKTCALVSAGALDGLTEKQVEGMTAGPEEESVYVVFNGEPYDLSLPKIEKKLKEKAEALISEEAAHILIRCTAPFSRGWGDMPVMLPYPVLLGVTAALLVETLGVIIPRSAQEKQCKKKWSPCAEVVVCEIVSPQAPEGSFREAARRLSDSGAAAILMDCMGYKKEQQDVLCDNFRIGPVLHSPSIYLSAVSDSLYYLTRRDIGPTGNP